MTKRNVLTLALSFALLAAARSHSAPADESSKTKDPPKVAEKEVLVVIDSAGKEQKLTKWKITQGVRHLGWLGDAGGAQETEAPAKGKKGHGPSVGPRAFVMLEDSGTSWQKCIMTYIPLESIRSIDFDNAKESMTVHVATNAKPADDITLRGPTGYRDINKFAIDAEVDKGDLGVAEVHYSGGIKTGIQGVRFPSPKPVPPENKDARQAAVSYSDHDNKYVGNFHDLQPLYRFGDEHEVVSPLLFFKKTVKIDLGKIKKIVPNKDDSTAAGPIWNVTLKNGDVETFTLLLRAPLDGKEAQLDGFVAKVPAGYRIIPVNNASLLQEIEFDTTKEAPKPEEKKKPDEKKK